jgi:GNAT superfamily N-acetyltransferase
MDKRIWQWERTVSDKTFLISSDKSLLPLPFVQEAYGTEAMFWATPLDDDITRTMLNSSLTLGLYALSNEEGAVKRTPIGMARMVTDYTTLLYLTDVYLVPGYRGLGLGKWIIQACRSIALDLPQLRFLILLAGTEQAQNLYRRELGMSLLDGREHKLSCMGARASQLAEAVSRDSKKPDLPDKSAVRSG